MAALISAQHVRAMVVRIPVHPDRDNWGNLDYYDDRDADIATAHGRLQRNRWAYAIACLLSLTYDGNADDGTVHTRVQTNRQIDRALPRCSTMTECIALYTTVRDMWDADDDDTDPDPGPAEEYDPDDMIAYIVANVPSIIVARETGDAVYFTYNNAARAKICTIAILRATADIVYDLYRSFHCDFTDVRHRLAGVARQAWGDFDGFVYLELEHLKDRYSVKALRLVPRYHYHSLPTLVHAISTQLAGWRYAEGEAADVPRRDSLGAEPVNERNYTPMAPPLRNATYVCHGLRYAPTMSRDYGPRVFDTRSLYNGPADLDDEYCTYCHRNAERPYTDGTRFMRDMQIQERTGSLAGIMARRYTPGMLPVEFVANMQLTSRRNQRPMDMDHTIQTLARLDVRRGPGTYSDYVRVPRRVREPRRPVGDFWPMYPATWNPLFQPDTRLEGQLVPTGI